MDGQFLPPPEEKETLADDILEGADLIAAFMWGSASKRRRVYHLMGTSRLPLFKIGNVWCARKSRLKEYIREQEDRNAAVPGARKPARREYPADDRAKALLQASMVDDDDLIDDDLIDEGLVDDDMPEDEKMADEGQMAENKD